MNNQARQLLTISSVPSTVVIWPQGRAVTAALLEVRCVSDDMSPSAGTVVQLQCPRGLLALHNSDEWSREVKASTDETGIIHFVFSAELGTRALPGIIDVQAFAYLPEGRIELATVSVHVVGPAAFMTMTAAPSRLMCGEMATILVTVTDALNQRVPDETPVKLITNQGGTLAPDEPKTFGGVATAFMLTSEAHSGSYEIVAMTSDNPPGTPPIMSVVTITASRQVIERTSIDEMLASLNRHVEPDSVEQTRAVKTIMFSDIENSTSGNRLVGDHEWSQIRHEHDALIREELAKHNGTEVKHQGDGFMCSFNLPGEAAKSAIAIQRRLADYRAAHVDGRRSELRVRIGLHSGEVHVEGIDLFGTEVNLAARVAGDARGSEILISDSAARMLQGRPELRFVDQKEIEPKGESRLLFVWSLDWAFQS